MSIFKDKIMNLVKERILDDSGFADKLAEAVIENIDYTELADNLSIGSREIADYISEDAIAEKVAENIDMADLASEIELDYSEVAKQVKRNIATSELYNSIANCVVDELIAEFND